MQLTSLPPEPPPKTTLQMHALEDECTNLLPPPPHCVPMVSILQFITYLKDNKIILKTAPSAHYTSYGPQWDVPSYTLAFRTSIIVCRGHVVWLAATTAGLACSKVLCSLLPRGWRQQGLPPLLSNFRRSTVMPYMGQNQDCDTANTANDPMAYWFNLGVWSTR